MNCFEDKDKDKNASGYVCGNWTERVRGFG
jgi:hypothetical protein